MRRRDSGQAARVLSRLTIVSLIALIVLYLAENYVGERHWITTLITYAPQHLFGLPAVLLLLWSILSRQRASLLINAAAVCFFLVTLMGFCLPLRLLRHGKTGPSVRVMTYNIHHATDRLPSIVADVKAANPDVVCFQEANAARGSAPTARLRAELRGWDCVEEGDIAVFSRLPILSQRTHHTPGISRVFIEVGVKAHGRRLTVIAAHLATSLDGSSLAHRRGSFGAYLRNSTQARSRQINEIKRVARAAIVPVVIAGDFNTPPRGCLYRRLSEVYDDSFRCAGQGFGYTFRSSLPVMRIDYIWAGQGLVPARAYTLGKSDSDHHPVIADLSFTAP